MNKITKLTIAILLNSLLFMTTIIILRSNQNRYERIEPASIKQIKQINYMLKEDVDIENVFVVKSKDFKEVYFMAAEIKRISSVGVGVWSISGTKSKPGMVMSINQIAKKFSICPFGPSTKAHITMSDDGALLVKEYVQEKIKKEK